MSSLSDFAWYAPDAWTNTHGHTVGASQNVPDLRTGPTDLASNSINPLSLDHTAMLHPELLDPGHTLDTADLGPYLGSLSWLADETPFGQTSSENNRTAGHQSSNLDYHPFIDITPMGPHIGESSRAPHTPMAGPKGGSHKGRRSDAETYTEPIKCEWKGCTYSGSFSRKIELKRHVETKHIFSKSYECPEPGCKRSFNRSDNLRAHLPVHCRNF